MKEFAKKIHFEKWKAWIYLAPALALLLIFTFWPIFNTVRISFLEQYNAAQESYGATFNVSLLNYEIVVDDPDFTTCLSNTLLLCFITVPISTILALLIAVCLNAIKPLQRFLQTIFFMPYVTNSVAIGMVFSAMFGMIRGASGYDNPESIGIVNTILGAFGIDFINWVNVGSSHFANMAVTVIYIVWNALPFKILILLGGLQSVNKQYYDAAKIDGTSRFRTFTRITVPLLSPMLAYVIITSFIGGFKEYSSIVGLFGDGMGPAGNGSMNTMVGFIYHKIGTAPQVASAGAIILFFIIFAVTMVNLYVSNKKTHY